MACSLCSPLFRGSLAEEAFAHPFFFSPDATFPRRAVWDVEYMSRTCPEHLGVDLGIADEVGEGPARGHCHGKDVWGSGTVRCDQVGSAIAAASGTAVGPSPRSVCPMSKHRHKGALGSKAEGILSTSCNEGGCQLDVDCCRLHAANNIGNIRD